MNVLKAAPYILCVIFSMGFVAFTSASVVVLNDMARERMIIAITMNATIAQISAMDIRDI